MKTYKEIILERMGTKPNEMTMRAIDCTDDLIEEMRMHHPDKVEHFLVLLNGEMGGGHFDSWSAWCAIDKMVPVSMSNEAMKKKLPESIEVPTLVAKAHQRADVKARSEGFSAPTVPGEYTEWDMLVTMAMFYSDYWNLDSDSVADFVYAYLSDPDYPTHDKIWRYIMKCST